jgi:Domain of unknown function (DUF222)
MTTLQLPVGMASMPPGPELAALLAAIDPTRIINGQIHQVLIAQYRQLCHEHARLLELIDDMGRRNPEAGFDRIGYLTEPSRFAADELRPTLAWTRRKAERELDFAHSLIHRLPVVLAALAAGDIDPAKAGLFDSYLTGVSDAEAERICAQLLPQAPGWTTSRLARELRRLAIGADPDKARDRYARGLAERRVGWYLNEDGTARLAVDGIAPDDAAAAKKRIDRLATQIQRAGHSAPLAHIRERLVIHLLDGTLDGLTREEIIAALLAEAPAGHADSGSARPGSYESGGDDPTGDPVAGESSTSPVAAAVRGRWGSEVRAEIGTLLGEDDHPGELPDLGGPVLADIARRVAARQRGGTWSFAVCDEQGYLLCAGLTRYRPEHAQDVDHGGGVEVALRLSQLERLAADPPAGWEKLVTDIAHQYQRWPDTMKQLDAEPGRRFPTVALRRYSQIRDRTCRGPGGCGCPASAAEYDHTIDYQDGGLTAVGNGGMCCSHDHDLKTKGGWNLTQPEHGLFEWVSPLGQVYRTRGDPIIAPIPEMVTEPPF